MNGRSDWDGMTGRGSRLGRSPWAFYLGTGAALAILRVALLAWLTHRGSTHTVSYLDGYLWEWAFYPERLIVDSSPFPLTDFSETVPKLVLNALVALVSFIIAMPILPLGWLMRRRRQNAGR